MAVSVPLRGWTATFDSYDPYRDVCYHRVMLLDAEQPVGKLMAEVGIELVGDDWTGPELANAAGQTKAWYGGYGG